MAAQLDLLPTLERFATELDGPVAPARRGLILAILERWQDDPQLTPQSRRVARALRERHRDPVSL